MKKTLFAAVLSVMSAWCSEAREVTLDEATEVARVCEGIDDIGVRGIKTVVPWKVKGKVVGYIAEGEGKVLILSSNTSMPPVLSIVDGSLDDALGSGFLNLMDKDVSAADDVMQDDAVPVLRSFASGSQPSVRSIADRNKKVWESLGIKTSQVGSPSPVKLLSTSGSTSTDDEDDDYVIPGFETGGIYTHWGQHVPRELPDYNDFTAGKTAGYVGWPLYNYYMLWYNGWGSTNGLNLPSMPLYGTYGNYQYVTSGGKTYITSPTTRSFTIYAANWRPRDFYPCGCVATAYAAMFQCMGVTGCVSSVRNIFAGKSRPLVNPCLWNDSLRIATNYVNTSGAFFTPDDPPNTATEEAWDYARYVSTVPGKFDWDILPWTYGGRAKTNVYYGIEKVHESMLTTRRCDADFHGLDDDGKVMAPGARELCGRITYNLGLMVAMEYRRSVSTATTSNFISNVKYSSTFPGFGSYGYVSPTWDGPTAGKIIRAGNPVAVSVYSPDEGGHAILAVGRKKIFGVAYTRLFMGWNGTSDSWYPVDDIVDIITGAHHFTAIHGMYAFGGYDGAAVPVHGKVVGSTGTPVGGQIVTLRNTRDNLVTRLVTGKDGYFRGWVRSAVKGTSAAPSDAFTYTVSCNESSYSFSANSYDLGDGAVRNPRYFTLATWSSQFPTRNVTFVVSTGNLNGYAFGSPYQVGTAASEARKRLKPLVVVSGTSGTMSDADQFVSSIGGDASSRFVFYFLDKASDSSFSFHDADYSLMVVDPNVFDFSKEWTTENGVLAYGSFSHPSDFRHLLDKAWKSFDRTYLWSDHL